MRRQKRLDTVNIHQRQAVQADRGEASRLSQRANAGRMTFSGHLVGRCMHIFRVQGDRIVSLDWS